MSVQTPPNAPAPSKGGSVFVRLCLCVPRVFALFELMFVRVAQAGANPSVQVAARSVFAIFCAFVK